MAVSKPLKPGESTISQRLARRGFPVMAHYIGAVLTWQVYADKEALEKEVARIEATFPFAPEYADFAAREALVPTPAAATREEKHDANEK